MTNRREIVHKGFHARLQNVGAELRQSVVDELLESLRDGAQVGDAGLDFGERLRAPLARRSSSMTLVLKSLA